MIQPIVLAGGKGARLWPLSSEDRPKQFSREITGTPPLAETLQRARSLPGSRLPIVVGNQRHRNLVEKSLAPGEIPILEPHELGTAASVCLGALYTLHSHDIVVVMPSDHHVKEEFPGAFQEAILAATKPARQGYIVSLGVKPRGPHTGYGYIEPLAKPFPIEGKKAFYTKTFHEKPNEENAKKYIERNALWNTGIFVASVATLFKYMPGDIAAHLSYGDFNGCPFRSVDRAVLEKAGSARMTVELEGVSWYDLGSWRSVLEARGPIETEKRSWGQYDVIHVGPYYKVKWIYVEPGKALSLQRHERRGEYWKVDSGLALADVSNQGHILQQGEDVYVPRKAKHKLTNLSPNRPLEITEIQLGDYLEEDDITRYDNGSI